MEKNLVYLVPEEHHEAARSLQLKLEMAERFNHMFVCATEEEMAAISASTPFNITESPLK